MQTQDGRSPEPQELVSLSRLPLCGVYTPMRTLEDIAARRVPEPDDEAAKRLAAIEASITEGSEAMAALQFLVGVDNQRPPKVRDRDLTDLIEAWLAVLEKRQRLLSKDRFRIKKGMNHDLQIN